MGILRSIPENCRLSLIRSVHKKYWMMRQPSLLLAHGERDFVSRETVGTIKPSATRPNLSPYPTPDPHTSTRTKIRILY